uniref:hypothetical protein n=1 Tax=Microbacterium azadirachtae TaxID=582680 RepID=UPI001114003C|nr:hypothetical protein [Microbacterium azadirachtae]
MATFRTDAGELTFRRDMPMSYRCLLTLWGNRLASGLITESIWSDETLESRLPVVRSAFGHVMNMDPDLLHSLVAARLPVAVDLDEFAKCEVVSLSAYWADEALHPVIRLAYGVLDDGVYALAEVFDGVVTATELNS